jgi:triacylglycerol lipase
MRGARGIEFGVDLPAIPSIGLGSVLPTSVKRIVTNTLPGDGWGFGDWTRFVGEWMKSKSEAATRDKDKTKTGSMKDQDGDEQASLSSRFPQKHETASVKRARERLADDDVVRSSTDTLSAVFDWLIERVPAPKRMLGVGSTESEGKASLIGKEAEGYFDSFEKQEKELGRLAVSYTVGHGVSSGGSSTTPSEIKRRMDREKANLKQKPNELGSKDDLERFYVALSRKIYDEGL